MGGFCTTLTAAETCGSSGCFFLLALCLPKMFHLRGDLGCFFSLFAAVFSESVLACMRGRELMVESSEKMVVSWLVMEGVTIPGRTLMGFGRRALSWAAALRRPIDLRYAKVDFMVRTSESLLSEGILRCPADGAMGFAPRGRAEGHKVVRASCEERDMSELFLEAPMLGRGRAMLWLLSVLSRSTLIFRFWITSPPAIITGLIRDARKGSDGWLLAMLSWDLE